MIRPIPDDISDIKFKQLLKPGDKIIKSALKDFVNEFTALCIATRYRSNAMWDENFDLQIKTSIEEIALLTEKLCNKKKIKKILNSKYKIKIDKEDPIKIIDIEKD